MSDRDRRRLGPRRTVAGPRLVPSSFGPEYPPEWDNEPDDPGPTGGPAPRGPGAWDEWLRAGDRGAQ